VTAGNPGRERRVRLYDCPGALHFIDPPYTTRNHIGAYKSWRPEDVERLRAVLAEINGKWIVTLND
jgi:site-specific DNA-adenine methylase